LRTSWRAQNAPFHERGHLHARQKLVQPCGHAFWRHRWAERDGTYDDLVAQRSGALAMLPGRQ